jgi:hypothetical protein
MPPVRQLALLLATRPGMPLLRATTKLYSQPLGKHLPLILGS